MKAVCTISTFSHVSKAVTMLLSATAHSENTQFYLLLLDKTECLPHLQKKYSQIKFLTLHDLPSIKIEALGKKYSLLSDSLRWSLKPVLLKTLITNFEVTEALYCDTDIFFFQHFDFLFDKLQTDDILLFPHWRINHPSIDKDWFETNFKDGIYNGGCVGVNESATAFLNWWADCCAYKCEIDFSSGMYVDQKYLDMVPALFENSHLVRHKGCNVAYWNIRSLARSEKNGKVMINETDEVIFVHFTGDYLRVLQGGEDSLMKPLCDEYLRQVQLIEVNLQDISAEAK